MSRTAPSIQREDIASIVSGIGTEKRFIIPILQAIQAKYNYLPEDALRSFCEITDITLEQVMGVASFYAQFRLEPVGEHLVKVCVGTACHIRGAAAIQDQIENLLGIKAGETTKDGKFTIEVVACVGACAMAPVVIVNDKYHGSFKVSAVKKLLKVK